MNVSVQQDKEHPLARMTALITDFIGIKPSRQNFLPYGLHVNVVLLLDHECLTRIKPHFHSYAYNIHILQRIVNSLSPF